MEDIEALRAAQAAAGDTNEDVFEEEVGSRPGKTAHHIRANSSIMHLNKILGESTSSYKMRSILLLGVALIRRFSSQSPTEVKFVSTTVQCETIVP